MIATLPHKLRRLIEMRPPELGHRMRESARRGVGRAAHRLRLGRRDGDDRLVDGLPAGADGPALSFLRHTSAPRSSLGTGSERRY
jgi:hypothetical protein